MGLTMAGVSGDRPRGLQLVTARATAIPRRAVSASSIDVELGSGVPRTPRLQDR